ncbi:sulfite oxidase heme-binding subunit YedZ [Azospirillum sp. CT11-132]|uniref:sulfite oxidase heme-binding subunit YedZ n=1 Tax=unclassified Azospirillum TaxID=2630922 RepID=UPI000D61E928|nr:MULTISPECIES: protein-methionine-sulfoxide reductase heme-binding subunit MsrQ [unclassified Azospirillum]PWC52672.1 sulfite oxidase [Azospirillum sp. TSH7]PWC57502.1 sulfite oxidase [Azospirillum sp. TSH20]
MPAPIATAGGVDWRTAANAALASRWAKPVVFTAALVPLVWTVWLAYTGELGAEPVLESVKASGLWALRFLLIALALTPLRMLTGVAGLARFRRMLGLFAFFYACVHLSTYIGLDQFFDWAAIWKDIVKRPYITVGMGAFLILTALAATSTDGMVKRLGGKRWRALHKGVFIAGLAGCLHFIMLVKGWQTTPLIYALICIGLLAFRRWPIRLGSHKDRRRKEARQAPVRTRPAAVQRSGEAQAPHFPDGSSPARRS